MFFYVGWNADAGGNRLDADAQLWLQLMLTPN
jgi:hypothetical protein